MILVVCAVADELRAFVPRRDVEIIAVGVGPVEAALGTARALAGRHVTLAVNAGIGGGFRARTKIGDAVAVTESHYVDLGLEGGGAVHLPGGIVIADRVGADAKLLARYAKIPRAILGVGVTSATITTSDERAHELETRYSPTSEAMEGFSVLRAAQLARIPAIELRGISNFVGNRAASNWDFRAGAAAVVAMLESFIDSFALRG